MEADWPVPVPKRQDPDETSMGDSRSLIEAACEDSERFAEIVDRTKGMVYAIAFGFFRNRATAEDLAQDAYLELFRHLHRLESDQHLVNWLRQTTTRKCIDYSRRKKNRPHLALESIPERGSRPAVRDSLMAEKLLREVDALPDRMRMVVLLRFQQELKLREIAEVLDMPVNTAKTLLRRALIRLRPRTATLRTEVALAQSL